MLVCVVVGMAFAARTVPFKTALVAALELGTVIRFILTHVVLATTLLGHLLLQAGVFWPRLFVSGMPSELQRSRVVL